jgi:hypothetical protein
MEENKILQKLEQHDQQFAKIDEHFVAVEKHFEAVDKHLDRHDQQFDRMFAKLVEHDEKLDNMMTKDDGRQIMDTLESIATTVQRLDQERMSTISRIDRIEDGVGIHGTEINKIKVQLNMP